jgi:hypothetical protein
MRGNTGLEFTFFRGKLPNAYPFPQFVVGSAH